MSFFQWIENAYSNGELFFYVVPVFFLIILFIVILVPAKKTGSSQEESEDKKVKEPVPEKKSLQEGLEKTRGGFISRLRDIFKHSTVDNDLIDELEEILYTSDIGVKTVSWLMEEVQNNKSALKEGKDIKTFIKTKIKELLLSAHKELPEVTEKPTVFLMVGVNGAGKTTTIGKMASNLTQDGKTCILAAADTFRAAAVEQIKVWGERTNATVISDKDGADPASVAHNAISSALSKDVDVVMVDTGGRLQNRVNLMEELKKVKRVISNLREGAPHETILVIDANTGQNALLQAKEFNELIGLSGIIVTKLDGTAKGGILIGIVKELSLPVYMIGIGESVQDLRPFNPEEFVETLFT